MFVWKKEIRRCFIILFYLLVFYCLVSWEITAILSTIYPETRYLVYQLEKNPSFMHVEADISQIAFLALFALVSATIFHLD